jgi:phage terminase small subunit
MNIRQKRFVEHYLETGNGAKAARFAGYEPTCAKQTAYRLLNSHEVSKELQRNYEFVEEEFELSRSKLIQMLIHLFAVSKRTKDRLAAVDRLMQLAGL